MLIDAAADMTFRALATDYDGTLAHDGHVDETTVAALKTAPAMGLRLVLVTGRELINLTNTFAEVKLFDRIVAENGAVLLDPQKQTTRLLASPPPQPLIERLTARQVPLFVGHTIVDRKSVG